MGRLYRVEPSEGVVELGFECPGCECAHTFRIQGPAPVWTWNGDEDRPTFAPSLVVQTGPTDPSAWPPDHVPASTRCHLFLRDGQIQFLADCTHQLAGQTVPMEDEQE